jgi:hypothetical protein
MERLRTGVGTFFKWFSCYLSWWCAKELDFVTSLKELVPYVINIKKIGGASENIFF